MLIYWELRAQVLFVSAPGQNQGWKKAHSAPYETSASQAGQEPRRQGQQEPAFLQTVVLFVDVLTHEPRQVVNIYDVQGVRLEAGKAAAYHLWTPGTWHLVIKVNYTATEV